MVLIWTGWWSHWFGAAGGSQEMKRTRKNSMRTTLKILILLLAAPWAQATLTQVDTGGIIPAGSPVGAVFTATLSGYTDGINANPTVSQLSVNLNISGGYNGNLYAYLIAPNGTLVVLMNQPGVAVNGFGAYGAGMNLTLQDGATANGSIQNATSGGILSGSYNAAGGSSALSAFDGSQVNGVWTLYFADLASGTGSSTLNWSIGLTPVPEPVDLALGLFAAMLLALAGLKWICRPAAISNLH